MSALEQPVIVQLEPEGGFYCGSCPANAGRIMDDPEQHYRAAHGLDDHDFLLVVAPEDA